MPLYRIAYGEEATPERNRMIDQAEQWLRGRGFHILRVRYHRGDLARIEVPIDDLPRFVELELCGELVPAFRVLGFKFVTLDLEGFRSGSLERCHPHRSSNPWCRSSDHTCVAQLAAQTHQRVYYSVADTIRNDQESTTAH